MDIIKLQLTAFASVIWTFYSYIFPEYPTIGVGVVGLTLLIFVVHMFKAGFFRAAKVAAVVWFMLTLVLLMLHHLTKILHLTIAF